eukprot:5191583-Pyramimonas_sp.AAC.1
MPLSKRPSMPRRSLHTLRGLTRTRGHSSLKSQPKTEPSVELSRGCILSLVNRIGHGVDLFGPTADGSKVVYVFG